MAHLQGRPPLQFRATTNTARPPTQQVEPQALSVAAETRLQKGGKRYPRHHESTTYLALFWLLLRLENRPQNSHELPDQLPERGYVTV